MTGSRTKNKHKNPSRKRPGWKRPSRIQGRKDEARWRLQHAQETNEQRDQSTEVSCLQGNGAESRIGEDSWRTYERDFCETFTTPEGFFLPRSTQVKPIEGDHSESTSSPGSSASKESSNEGREVQHDAAGTGIRMSTSLTGVATLHEIPPSQEPEAHQAEIEGGSVSASDDERSSIELLSDYEPEADGWELLDDNETLSGDELDENVGELVATPETLSEEELEPEDQALADIDEYDNLRIVLAYSDL